MTPQAPSEELEKWIIYELYNIHLKEGAPENVKKEFDNKFSSNEIIIE